MRRPHILTLISALVALSVRAQTNFCPALDAYFHPPSSLKGTGNYSSLLRFEDGREVRSALDWAARRREIRATWEKYIGKYPPLITNAPIRVLSSTNRDNFVQKRVEVTVAKGLTNVGWLLVPNGRGPFPAVIVPFYEPETSIGMGKAALRDFGLQLARRGFVTLSIGSPGGDARAPELAGAECQPLAFLGYIASNCRIALSKLPEVDAKRMGIVGHSYGGKWAMFAACLDDQFACAAFSDPGIVFDEARPNVNYWEPWYLGKDNSITRKPGVLTAENGRTGAYRDIVSDHHDLHELLALMAPRPFLVSGGSEDQQERWLPLNRVREVYDLLGFPNRIGMTNRPKHDPTEESNEAIYQFFECALKR